MRATRVNITVLHAFIIISFLNRCLNPFIYASQYEVVRRTPMIEFLRDHIAAIRLPVPTAAARKLALRCGLLSPGSSTVSD